jgi:hypothetical protein
MPHDFGTPLHEGASPAPAVDAKVENFFTSFFEPHRGQAVPFQSLERTRISLSRSHFSQ